MRKTILYFGIFDPDFSRNKIYADGLRRRGYEVIILCDRSPGLLKFWRLYRKHRLLRGKYDVMIVGFPGYIVAPFARLITSKPIIYDALCSFHETQIISRDAYRGNPFRTPYVRTVDAFANRSADRILVETERQKAYFSGRLRVPTEKLVVTYTGADDSIFQADASVRKRERFTAIFRGRITREAGAVHVLRAAKLLEGAGIDFIIIGFGWAKAMSEFDAAMDELKPANVRHIRGPVPAAELPKLMLECHASLGQFGTNERLDRTIPHKAFESMALGLPYVTARAAGVREVMTDGKDCLMVHPASPEDIAKKMLLLKNDPVLAKELADNALKLYQTRFAPEKIVQPIIETISAL